MSISIDVRNYLSERGGHEVSIDELVSSLRHRERSIRYVLTRGINQQLPWAANVRAVVPGQVWLMEPTSSVAPLQVVASNSNGTRRDALLLTAIGTSSSGETLAEDEAGSYYRVIFLGNGPSRI